MSKPGGTVPDRLTVPAIQVRQWLPEWSDMAFGAENQAKPKEHFYVFSLAASTLKSLSGINRRETDRGQRRTQDLGIQRRHDSERSDEIREFVRFGFPWSDLTDRQKKSEEFNDLKKPGWLPTAIVVNILGAEDRRAGLGVDSDDLIAVDDQPGGAASISIPSGSASSGWSPAGLRPLEVIDGQHRLWAFQPGEYPDDFQLPVVAFHGLDISWQAYLFWTINIKPKKINASLAFDLYPLLRTEDWLQRFEGPAIYKETRAQELTELLWAYPRSPWFHRINMLGEKGHGGVSQSAWIRSLTNSFIKAWEGPGVRIGGLFGAPVGADQLALPWTREQQAGFLIFAWEKLKEAIDGCDDDWASSLRSDRDPVEQEEVEDEVDTSRADDPAFSGKYSLLNTDQGVRGFLQVVNDVCYVMADELALRKWPMDRAEPDSDLSGVEVAIEELEGQPVRQAVVELSDALAHFDWRTSSHPSLSEDQRTLKGAFRGSGGYRELRRQLLSHLEGTATPALRAAATELRDALNMR